MQIPRSIIVLSNDQSVIEQLKLIKLLGFSQHHGAPTCQKRLFVTHLDSIYTKWQGDEAMFLSRRALTPGRDHILSSLIHNPDTIKTWQAHSWCSDIPAIPSSPCLISDLDQDLVFIHEMLIMTLRTNKIKMVTRYVSGEMVRPQITRSRNLTRAEICPSYCQTWCRARGPKLDSRHVDIGTCNKRLVRNRFVSMLTHFGGDKHQIWTNIIV